MPDTPNYPDNTPESKVRRLTSQQQRAAFVGKGYGPSSKERTEEFEMMRRFGDAALQAWDWTRIPLRKIYQMRCDPMIQFGLQFIKVPLIRAPWYIECEDPQVAAFVTGALNEIWTSFVFQYTNCYDFGYQPIIKNNVLSKPDWTYLDPEHSEEPKQPVWSEGSIDAIVWKCFTQVPPEHAMPMWTDAGEFDGFKWNSPASPIQSVQNLVPVPNEESATHVPVEQALWATNAKEKVHGSLYGESLLIPVYRYWWSYWFRWALADRAFEKHIDPALVVFHPPEVEQITDEDQTTFGAAALGLDLFDRARSGSTITLPNARFIDENGRAGERMWQWEQLSLDSNFSALQDTFNYLDVMKLRALAVPEHALIEGHGGTSSRNVASHMGDKFFESQYVRMREIDEHVNRYLIPQLVALNFPEFKGSCKKVTRGFASMDINLATQIFQLIGQAHPDALQMVNLRDLLAQYNVPLMDANTLARQQAEQAAMEQAALAAQVTANPDGTLPAADAKDGSGNSNDGGANDGTANGNQPPPNGDKKGPKKPTNEAITGSKAPVSRGLLKAAEEGVELFFDDQAEEDFIVRMREMYAPMEDDRFSEPATDLQEQYETTLSKGYLAIRALLLLRLTQAQTQGEQLSASQFVQDAYAEAVKVYAKATAKTAKLLLKLLTASGENAAISLGYLPAVIGNDFKDAENWAKRHASELSDTLAQTTREEIHTFLRGMVAKGQSPTEIIAKFDDHFFHDSAFPTWRSAKIARGESMQTVRMGQLYAAKSLGATHVRATDASHGTNHQTDEHCKQRNGQDYTIEEAVQETLHQTHPNCTLQWTVIPPTGVIAAENLPDELSREHTVEPEGSEGDQDVSDEPAGDG